jgi:hypothetical protein
MAKTVSEKLDEYIDDLCIHFDNAKIEADGAQQKLSGAKGELLAAVQAWGYVPAHAEKTMRLEGQLYIADATVASTVEINEASVGELQSELSRLKRAPVFRKCFELKVKHVLLKDAADTLKLAIGGFAEDVQKRLLGIFAGCFAVNTKAPALSVYLADALRKKEAAAAERAAKKAKKGGK